MTTLEKIDKLRIQRGWSINNLALEAMLTQSTINNLYSRKTEPKLSTLRAICEAFGITLSEFFKEESDDSESEIDKNLQKKISALSLEQKKTLLAFLKTL
ncbi:MAG: helix-turn-helix transcriptional regulator [Clostridia bacterium]|nr:helix-turn-helix transcriptional regulator [Clostridia bacterium]